MGFVGLVLELLWAIPQYTWRVCVSAFTSLTLVWEFFRLVIRNPDAGSARASLSWTELARRTVPNANLHVLIIPAVAILVHYLAYAILTRLIYPSFYRPSENGHGAVAAGADRIVWAAVSTGVGFGWTMMFWKLIPAGRLGIYKLDPQTIGLRVEMLLAFVVPYFLYALITGLTSKSRPGGFLLRKFIPAFAVMVFLSGKRDAGAGIRVAAWLLRVLIADAISDTVMSSRMTERLTAATLLVWTLAAGSMYNEYGLFADDAFGVFPCVVITGMALWAYLLQIKYLLV